jgi:dipeptidyl aminopeptidase/acylaminoacyl peptidase
MSIHHQRGIAGFAALFTLLAASLVVGVSGARSQDEGGSIVFDSDRGSKRNLWVMHADGSNLVQLTDDKIEDVFPEWSPDGTKIAWTRGGRGPEGEIWVMDADGTDATRITFNGFPGPQCDLVAR